MLSVCNRSGLCTLIVLLLGIVLTSSGCGRPKATWIRPAPVVGVNEQGESVPVNVRLYQLKHWKKFREAPFDQLWADAAETLGDDLLGKPFDITVHPDESDQPWMAPYKQALPAWESGSRYLGAIILNPKAPEKGDRRVIMAAKDAYSYDIVVENGALSLKDR